MRWRWTKWVAAALALGGCKATEKKSPDRDAPSAAASRAKGKAVPTWLDDVKDLPGGNAAVPKADSWADPNNPNTDIAAEVRGVLGGVVLDPDGHRAGNVGIQIEPADAPVGPVPPAPMAIVADRDGYFLTKGLKPGRAYTLTVRAKVEGRAVVAVLQTRVPNPNMTIRLRDDLGNPTTGPNGLPPAPGPSNPPAIGGANGLPPPADLTPPAETAPRPSDGSWTPGGATAAPLHKVVPAPAQPVPTPTGRPAKPENVAGDPRPDWRAPAASIPTPTLPPPITPLPAPTAPPADPTRTQSNAMRPTMNFVLADTSNRLWTFDSSHESKLVLLEFMTTTCGPCRKSVPILVALQGRYAARRFQVLGIVCDEASQAERLELATKYGRELSLNYGLYVEPGARPGGVRDRFKVEAYPTAILLDEYGNELWRGHPNGNGPQLEVAIRNYLSKH